MCRAISWAVAALLPLSVAGVAAADDAATYESGWGDDAIAACTRVIEPDPTDATAYYNRGVAQEEIDRSESDFGQAMKLGFGREDNRAVSGHVARNVHAFMCGHLGGCYYAMRHLRGDSRTWRPLPDSVPASAGSAIPARAAGYWQCA